MRNSERLQQEADGILQEVESFLHKLTFSQLPSEERYRSRKLESKVRLFRAKIHLNNQRAPFSSLRFPNDPFPKDLDIKRPRSLTSPEQLYSILPDVPEEEEQSPGTGQEPLHVIDNENDIDQIDEDFFPMSRPRAASFPLSL